MTSPTAIDLFSGAGGLSLGFLLAGGEPLGAVDSDFDSIATFQRNFPMSKENFHGLIQDWQPKNRFSNLDVVIGGPPCQGFSLARGTRFVDDPRNLLYKEFIRVVDHFKPKFFVMENVQGITNLGAGVIYKQILEDFESLGYNTTCRVINMAEYGVPQLRKRAVFVGSRLGESFIWPPAEFKNNKSQITLLNRDLPNFVSVNDAIGNLNFPVGNFFAHRANSKMRGPRNRCAHTEPAFTLRTRGDEFALCSEPALNAFVPGAAPSEKSQIEHYEPQNELQYFFHQTPKYLSERLRTKVLKGVNSTQLKGTRKLTVIEQARLQSFPDWFQFSGTVYSQGRQIGNAVPPLFAMKLFKQIFLQL